MTMRDLLGRDLSRDLDNYITGHYGEDQFKRGSMRKSEHYSDRHPAVAAVACPTCQRGPGLPCVVARTGQRRTQHGNETHVRRVRVYETQQQEKARFEELARVANVPSDPSDEEQNPFAGYHPDDQAAAASANMPERPKSSDVP